MCYDSSYECCYGIFYEKLRKRVYRVFQWRKGLKTYLGTAYHATNGWYFVSSIHPRTNSIGSTRIKALRAIMNDYIIQCPVRNVPLFDRCDCLISGSAPVENIED